MKFRTKFDKKERVYANSGNNVLPEYVLAYHDDGTAYLKECGKKNIYKMIQAHRDSCDMKLIESKLDPAMLSNALSSFRVEDLDSQTVNDLTIAPSTLGDALNAVKAAENLFDGLPLEVRKEFNFSSNSFIKNIGKPKFNEIFGQKKDVAQKVVSEVPVKAAPEVPAMVEKPVVKKAKRKKIVEIEVDDDE